MTVEEAHEWLQGKRDGGREMMSISGQGITYKDRSVYLSSCAQYEAAKCQEALAVLHYHENDRYGFLDDKPIPF